MSAVPSRGLGSPLGGLLRPSEPVPPVVEETPELAEELPRVADGGETPRRRTVRRRKGVKVLKVALPAALAERVLLQGMLKGQRPSTVVADLVERHLPKLVIRQG